MHGSKCFGTAARHVLLIFVKIQSNIWGHIVCPLGYMSISDDKQLMTSIKEGFGSGDEFGNFVGSCGISRMA